MVPFSFDKQVLISSLVRFEFTIKNFITLYLIISFSLFTVDFQDGAKIWWDGSTRAYIDVPASYRGKTRGLCGTFNSNMQDDFLTPEGTLSFFSKDTSFLLIFSFLNSIFQPFKYFSLVVPYFTRDKLQIASFI
jgi:hypothetical protein